MLPKLSDATQNITFSEGDGVTSTEVFASSVIVTSNAGLHNHGSSKFKLKNLVDYNWELRFYSGQLLAVHMSGKYLAYAIKAPNNVNGLVRVIYNPETGTDIRTLIKGMKGEVHDLSFAHIENEVIVACIDEQGTLFVHSIELIDNSVRCNLMLEITEDTGLRCSGVTHRVVWCPYIPDEDDEGPDEDVARLLVTTHSNTARMWSLSAVIRSLAATENGRCGCASTLMGREGVLESSEHSAPLVDAAFSPDGTALATASMDGYVMFFQVYMHEQTTPRCLHKWQPHSGKPLSCLFFLDNHKNYNTDVQFWKFAVTGADNNTVLKIWSCKSWSCLQTMTFTSGPSVDMIEPLGLKAMLDSSAAYLLLSDFRARTLYVLQMAHNHDDALAYCRSISEFLLPYPVLGFYIVDAGEHIAKCESSCGDPFHQNGSSGDNRLTPTDYSSHRENMEEDVGNCVNGASGSSGSDGNRRVRLSLYIVHPKGLQAGELIFAPPSNQLDVLRDLSDFSLNDESLLDDSHGVPQSVAPTISSSILQQQSQQLKSLLMRSQTQPGSLISQRPESPLNLMTPDAFSCSPGKREEDDPPLSATPEVAGKSRSGSHILNTSASSDGVEPVICESKFISVGSSPSREVQEIMSLNDSSFYKNELSGEGSQSPDNNEQESDAVQNGSDTIFVTGDIYLPKEKSTQKSISGETAWPQISMAQINEANQRKASSDKSSSQSLNNPLNMSNTVDVSINENLDGGSEDKTAVSVDRACLSAEDKSRLEAIERKLENLTDLLSQQSRELRALRSEVIDPRETIEQALLMHTQKTSAAIQSALADGWDRIAVAGEAAGAEAARAAGVGAARALEPLVHALQHELAAKLSATDQLLRENIDKLVHSKSVMDSLSTAVAQACAGMVRDSFRETMAQNVVPVMEKAHAQIFRQINQAFQNGTKDFAVNTEAAARAAAERGGAAAAASLHAALERHADAITAAAAMPPSHQISAILHEAVHTVLQKEMAAWREQAHSVVVELSRAHSPATPSTSQASILAMDRQMQVAQVQSLLTSGDPNAAFQLALSASDLSLVVAACRAADPALVFSPPCRLKQHVLLSLVQQLAADMSHDTQLKHRFLEEAIMNLDPSNPVTREHLPVVIKELQKQLVSFQTANPGHTLCRQFKMLLMAAESLIKANTV